MQVAFKIVFTLIISVQSCLLNAQEKTHTDYYTNGEIKAVGVKTENGKTIGKWVYYRKDGSIDAELNFNTQGNPEGAFVMYYRNGQLQTKGSYSGDGFYEMDGSYEDYYSNGQLKSVGTYKKNKTIGEWQSYFDNGNIESLTTYTSDGTIQKNTAYFKNGQLRLAANYNAKGDFIGELVIFYDNGQVRSNQQFTAEGHKKGTYKSYYKDGSLLEVGDYAGLDYFKKTGTWLTYHNNGELKKKINFDSNGKRIGEILVYDTEGNLINSKSKNQP